MIHKTRTKALSWLLSLALMLSLIPGMSLTAWADDVAISSLWIGSSSEIKTSGDVGSVGQTSGTATVSTENGSIVLELNNFTFNAAGHTDTAYVPNSACIFYEGTTPPIIKLTGTNTITTSAVDSGNNFGIYSFKSAATVTIKGPGTLTVKSGNAGSNTSGIRTGGEVTFVDCAVSATGGSSSDTSGTNAGIDAGGDITVDGANLTATSGTGNAKLYGIKAYSGSSGPCNIIVKSGTVTATGNTSALYYNSEERKTSLKIADGSTLSTLNVGEATGSASDVELSAVANQKCVYAVATAPLDPVASVTPSGGAATNYTDFAAAVTAWNTAGSGATLKLLADVETDSGITANTGYVNPMILDLNGYGIRHTGTSGSVIIVSNDGNLKLTDSDASSRKHYITLDENGRGVSVADSGTPGDSCVEVTGGYITGGLGRNTGGTNTMGGGVYSNSGFTMEGGTIIGNTVSPSSGEGRGGGVYVGIGTFTMTGGTITRNRASTSGGGVYVQGGSTFKLSGNAVIKDNLKGTDKDNVYLSSGRKITITDALTNSDPIGVTMQTPGVFTEGGKAKDYAANFTSDDPAYSVVVDGNELKLSLPPVAYMAWDEASKTVKAVEGGCTSYTVVTAGTDDTLTTIPEGWYVITSGEAVATQRLVVNGTVNLILCDGATLTAQKGITVSEGNILNIYAQSEGADVGKLVADASTAENKAAGIGGVSVYNSDSGTYDKTNGKAGTVTIHGGNITATGNSNSAGIGGGSKSAGGSVTIYSGTITATGGNCAAGIGGGMDAAGGTVTILGGTVMTTGGTNNSYPGAGIGAGNGSSQHGDLIVAATHITYSNKSAITGENKSEVADKVQGTGSAITIARKQYMLVEPGTLHKHNFTYEGTGATITATCGSHDGCPLESSSYQATLTISAAGGTYDGTTTYGATVTNNIPAVDGVTVGEIEYYKVSTQGATTGGTKQTGAPTDAGYYYASVTLTSGSNSYTAVKAFTISPKALTITGATLTARNYAEDDKNVTVSAVTFDNATLTLGTDYTATAEMANDTAGSAKPATVTVTLTNGNYSLAQNTYTGATVQINKIEYTGSKTAAANLRGTNGATAEVTLPALPTGASYGAVTNSNTDYFTVGTVADGKVTVTAAKDFNQATESADKTFTVAVSGATNYNNYTVTVTITPIFKSEQTITAENVTATYGDTGKSVSATTDGDGAISYAVKPGSEGYISVNPTTGALTIKKVGTAAVIVTAAETDDYAAATTEVTVTIRKATPRYTVPTGLTATCGQTLADVTLPSGWAWADNTQDVGVAGTHTFKANFTPTDTTNYNTVSDIDVSVAVSALAQAAPALTITAQPATPYVTGTINEKTGFAGLENLVVSTDGGETWADVTALPCAAKPGTVQFKYKADENHTESAVTTLLVEPVNVLAEVKITSDQTDANLYKDGVTNTLTAVTNSNVEGLTLEYKWYREGVEAAIGTGSTYTLQASDVDKKLTVVVTDKTEGATAPYAAVSTSTPVIVTVMLDTYEITGNVKVPTTDGGSEYNNVANANVELRQGNTVFATATTDSSGNYTFSSVPNGEYNIVVTDANGTTKTEYVKVENGNQTINVTMPFYKVSSKVDVKGETPAAVVAGLDDAAADSLTDDEKASGVTTTMTMEIESTDDLTAKSDDQLTDEQKQEKTEQQAIKAQNTGTNKSDALDFIDMSVYKRTQKDGESAQVEDVHNLNKVLEILLPYATANRSFNIFRYHGSTAAKFTQLSTRPTGSFTDGKFFVGDGFIAIYASGFSTYAIGYSDATSPTPTPTPSYPSSGGNGGYSPSTTAITVPVSGDSASVSVSASVSGATATVKAPTTAQLDKVIGESVKTGEVTIDVSGLHRNIATVSIPTETVKAIEKAVNDPDNDAGALTVKLTDGSVTFDAKALAAITDQAKGGTIQLNLDGITESGLRTAQKTAIKDMDVQAIYDAYLTSNGQRISDFKGGKATVTVSYTLKDGQIGRGVVVWYVADDGKTAEVPTAYNDKTVSFTVEHFSNYVIAYDAERAAACPQDSTCPISAFTDADPTAWYHDGVHYVLENGIMSGLGNGQFAPNDTTSRAMLAQILYNMEGKPAIRSGIPFEDVSESDWYAMAISWAESNGIIGGYGNGKFGPNDDLTREQLVTIMYRYAKNKGIDVSVGEDTNILSYNDAFDVSEWAIPAMQWAVGNGLISGRTASTLNPKDKATRAEIATIIMRYCEEIAK